MNESSNAFWKFNVKITVFARTILTPAVLSLCYRFKKAAIFSKIAVN